MKLAKTRKPSIKLTNYAEGGTLPSIKKLVGKCKGKDAKEWVKILGPSLRVITVVHYCHPAHAHKAVGNTNPPSNLTINGSEIVQDREFKIQILDSTSKAGEQWLDLFYVKRSRIPDAGYGLFALQKHAPETILGVYAGLVEKLPGPKQAAYSMQLDEDKYIVQEGISGGAGKNGGIPTLFGFHFCNDLCFGKPKKSTRNQEHNVYVSKDGLVVCAAKEINIDDELYMDYNGGD